MTQTRTEPQLPSDEQSTTAKSDGIIARVRPILARRTEGRAVALLMVV